MSDRLDALGIAYADLISISVGLDEAASWQPTGCAGWAVRDLVFHLLGDAQRALVAFATPASAPPDRDFATYWIDAPGAPDPDSRSLRAVRTMASAWKLANLTAAYAETAQAVLTLARRTDPGAALVTQGHVLRADDLVATLAVEAAVHHLDLVIELDEPGPRPEPLGVTRATLDALLGRPAPLEWSDEVWALVGTGRRPASAEQRDFLGADANRLPLLS